MCLWERQTWWDRWVAGWLDGWLVGWMEEEAACVECMHMWKWCMRTIGFVFGAH